MKSPLIEITISAGDELDAARVLMHEQLMSGVLAEKETDDAFTRVGDALAAWHSAYGEAEKDPYRFAEITNFNASDEYYEFNIKRKRYGRIQEHYREAFPEFFAEMFPAISRQEQTNDEANSNR